MQQSSITPSAVGQQSPLNPAQPALAAQILGRSSSSQQYRYSPVIVGQQSPERKEHFAVNEHDAVGPDGLLVGMLVPSGRNRTKELGKSVGRSDGR